MGKAGSAVTVALITSTFIQAGLVRFTDYFPVQASDYLVRFLACLIGAILARFFWLEDHYLTAIALVAFFLLTDFQRVREFVVIDWHPFQWVSFFPGPNVFWLFTLIVPTMGGAVVGRWLGTAFRDKVRSY